MNDFDIIHSYTRAEALNDGLLIDVSKLATEAGFVIPVAVTRALYYQYLTPDDNFNLIGQSVDGRTWDMLFLLRLQILQSKSDEQTTFFKVIFLTQPRVSQKIRLKAVIDGGDDGNPVVTIMLENED